MRREPTVFVVDDDPDLCEALRYLIESEGLAVETYLSAQDFLEAYDPRRPGCLVLDVRMHSMSGLDLQKHLSAWDSSLPVIILTGHGDVPSAVRAMRTGALDFLQKGVSDQVLLDRIYDALELDARNRQQKVRKDKVAARLACLTPREREVMDLIVSGKANKQIAEELEVSEKTVEVHRKRVMKKMRVKSAVRLVHAVLSVRQPEHAG